MKDLIFILSKNYKQLTERDKDFLYQHHVINGCGGKGSSFRPPMYLFFHADCDIHDFTYWQGGDEDQRKNCDDGFLERMLKDADRCGFLTRWFYKLWARIYHKAVRKHGAKYFNYTAQFII